MRRTSSRDDACSGTVKAHPIEILSHHVRNCNTLAEDAVAAV